MPDADRIIAESAEISHGAVEARRLLELGVSRHQIDRRVRRGTLLRPHPGVLVVAGAPVTDRLRIAVSVYSTQPGLSAASHRTAAQMWGMLRLHDAPIDVVVDRWDRRHRSHVVHESTDLVAADVTVVDGIRCTSPARTIVDLGAVAPGLVNAAFDRGRRLGLVQLAEVKALVARVARRGRRGVGAARRLLASWDAVWEKTESEAERRFVELLAAVGLRLPEPQVEVRTPNGWFVARVDFVYRSERLAIWIDGETYHSDSGTFQRDRDQQNALMGLGYRVYRFTWFDVTRRADWVATTVARALRGGESVLA